MQHLDHAIRVNVNPIRKLIYFGSRSFLKNNYLKLINTKTKLKCASSLVQDHESSNFYINLLFQTDLVSLDRLSISNPNFHIQSIISSMTEYNF